MQNTELSASSNSAIKTSPVIALVAGEVSGDLLGADLMAGLKNQFPDAKFVGIGGLQMQAQGLESWYPIEDLSVMGFFEVLKNLFKLLKLRKQLLQRLLDLKPDVFIGIDAPDFNFYLEKQLKDAGIKTVHYVGPSVWAWREKRLEKIKLAVDGMLVLFPFETAIYDKYQIPVEFVGHPLAQKIATTRSGCAANAEESIKQAARKNLSIEENIQLTAILPGSRMSEIERMIDVYLLAAQQLNLIYPTMEYVIPFVHDKARQAIENSIAIYGQNLKIHLIERQADQVLLACDQALVTSGTATLQTALSQRPMVIAIKVHPISYQIMKRLAISKWIGLPNVLAQKDLVPELIQDQATPEKIALALGKLIADQAQRSKQLNAFAEQLTQLNQDSSSLAANAVVKWAGLNG